MSHRQLTARLEQLTEEHSLQSITPHPSSLLCEIEQSMEQEEQEQEREQVKKKNKKSRVVFNCKECFNCLFILNSFHLP